MSIDTNIRASNLQNKYVKESLDMEFIRYVGANYTPENLKK